jgi:DNA repair protein RecN (Recombination protein N)
MLAELRIQDFAIIDTIQLKFDKGFNVLTGETGAGKSIILDAVTLLLGGRADTDIVRSKADMAQVEGVFKLDKRTAARINPIIESEGLEGDSPNILVLAREVRTEGRNICRINGRTVTLALLRQVGEGLIDIHGQSEHLSLLDADSHIDLLDRYAGLESQRESFAVLVQQVYAVNSELEHLLRNEQELARRAEILAYEVEEIAAARLKPGEDVKLREERLRLANAEQLASLSDEAYAAIYEEGPDGHSAADLISQAAVALSKLFKIDANLREEHALAQTLSTQVEELARNLRDYREGVEYNPRLLRETEERLDFINALKRKYNCDSIDALLAHAQQAATELEAIEGSEERIEHLSAEQERLLRHIGREGAALSSARVAASDALAQAIEAELTELKMDGARFGVSVEQVDNPQGAYVGDYRVAFDATGIDAVEFLIAPNVGEPLKPIARIASGGETSRLMLALKTVLSRADHTPTLIFDEIDAGIGGRIGAVVGRKLWGLSDAHQVMVVTHLPQLAGFGDGHFKVEKQIVGKRTVTRVARLKKAGRVEELTEMLGPEAESARQSAQEIMEYVGRAKKGESPALVNS